MLSSRLSAASVDQATGAACSCSSRPRCPSARPVIGGALLLDRPRLDLPSLGYLTPGSSSIVPRTSSSHSQGGSYRPCIRPDSPSCSFVAEPFCLSVSICSDDRRVYILHREEEEGNTPTGN